MKHRLSSHFVHLTHLSTVVDCGSINRAATLLGITQPALTRNISRLEEILDARLLLRTSKGVTPTDFARVLLTRIRAANAQLLRAEDELRELTGAVDGTIACGAGAVLTTFLIPAALHRFHKQHARVHLRLVDGHTPALLDRLRSGEVDLVVGSRIDDRDNFDLTVEPLVKERIEVYAGRGHPVLGSGKPHLADLISKWKWVLPGTDVHLHRLISAELRRLSINWPAAYVETTATQAARWLVRDAGYLTISTSLAYAADLPDRTVQPVRGDWAFPVTQTVLYRRQESPTPARVVAFVKALKQTARCWPGVSV